MALCLKLQSVQVHFVSLPYANDVHNMGFQFFRYFKSHKIDKVDPILCTSRLTMFDCL